jgi:hypothetical protein
LPANDDQIVVSTQAHSIAKSYLDALVMKKTELVNERTNLTLNIQAITDQIAQARVDLKTARDAMINIVNLP